MTYLSEVSAEHGNYSRHKVELVEQRLRDHLQGEGIVIVHGL